MRSLGSKVLAALGVTLAVATAVSVAVDAQITTQRVRAQAENLVSEQLDIVAQSIADDRARRLTTQRFLAGRLRTEGAGLLPSIEAQSAVGEAQLSVGSAGAQLISVDGELLASTGTRPSRDALEIIGQAVDGLPLIVRSSDGLAVEVTPVSVNADVRLLVTEPFGDPLAFDLRRLIGDDVVLLHRGQAVGATTPDTALVERALAAGADDDNPLPTQLTSGGSALIGTTSLGDEAAVAVITPELLQGLSRSLAGGRVITFLVLASLTVLLGYLFVRRLTRPLQQLAATADAIRQGEEGRRFVLDRDDDIGALAATLEGMRRTLASQVGIITGQSQQLQASSARLASARDEERRRLARDLHDGIQQQLVMLRLRVSLMEDGDRGARKELADEIDHVIEQLRETSQRIFPSILADRGLTGGLRSLVSGLPVQARLVMEPDPLVRMPPEVEAAIYFVVAEATTNAIKHARASLLHIRATQTDDAIEVRVADEGAGFSNRREAWGSGLQNIHDRVTALRGTARLRSTPGSGTTLDVQVPLPGGPAVPPGRVGLSPRPAAGSTAPPQPAG